MSNKIKYGLRNVHYSVITVTNGVPSYATPVPIPGAVNLSLSPAGEKYDFYADDMAYFNTNTNNGYEGSVEIALIPDSFSVDVMGDSIDANGAIVENANAIPKSFAMMFEFQGDSKATRHVLYNVLAARPNVEGATKTQSIEAKTDTLEITASPAVDTSNVKAKLEAGKTGYSTFYGAVYLEDAVSNTVTPATQTFDKSTPADVVIDSTSTGAVTVKNVLFAGAPIPGASLTVAGPDVTIAQAYLAAQTNGTYPVVVEFTAGNAVTVTLTIQD